MWSSPELHVDKLAIFDQKRSNFCYLSVCFWSCSGRFLWKFYLVSQCFQHVRVIEPAKDDLIMGERAAARANNTLDKCLVSTWSDFEFSQVELPAATARISGMYVGKNVGVSRAVGNSLEKVFGKKGAKDEGPAV